MAATTITARIASPARTARPASDRQRGYAQSLLAGRDLGDYTALQGDLDASTRVDAWTSANASAMIDWLLTLPRKPAAVTVTPAPGVETTAEAGYYVVAGTVFVVVTGKHNGRLYAKRLVVTSYGKARWDYAPGVHRTLDDSQRLTATEAARLGHLFGVCVRCARSLTDVRSNAAGYGQTCAKNAGWDYPSKKQAEAMISYAAL